MQNLSYVTLENLRTVPDAIAGCIYDSWKPAIDMLFDEREAKVAISHLMDKDKSELARKNIHVMLDGAHVAGVTVAIDMSLLKAAQRTNFFCYMSLVKNRPAFLQKVEEYNACFAPFSGEGTYLSKFSVTPSYRGKGLGKKLMEYFIGEERKKETPAVYLEVHQGNRAAISLYKKFSFMETGENSAAATYKIMLKKLAY